MLLYQYCYDVFLRENSLPDQKRLLTPEKAASKVSQDAVFKIIKTQFNDYLFINCFGIFINFRFHANSLKMNNYIYNAYQ